MAICEWTAAIAGASKMRSNRWIFEYRGLAYFDFCDIMKSIMLKESYMTHQETPDMAVSGVSAY